MAYQQCPWYALHYPRLRLVYDNWQYGASSSGRRKEEGKNWQVIWLGILFFFFFSFLSPVLFLVFLLSFSRPFVFFFFSSLLSLPSLSFVFPFASVYHSSTILPLNTCGCCSHQLLHDIVHTLYSEIGTWRNIVLFTYKLLIYISDHYTNPSGSVS